MKAELPNLQKNGTVILDETLTDYLNQTGPLRSNINVSEEDGLLSVRFSVEGIAEEEVDHILEQLDMERPYVTRDNGDIFFVDEVSRKTAETLLKIRRQGKLKNGAVSVHASRAFSVQAALDEDGAVFDQTIQRMLQDLAHPEAFQVAENTMIKAELRPYQKIGVQWLEMLNSYHFGGILADEMGLGKTLQMIVFLANHRSAEKASLIVAPASLIYNWQEELHKFAPHLSVVVIDGTKAVRKKAILENTAEIMITSYAGARLDFETYQTLKLHYLVMDEAQYVKNSSTKTNQNLRKLTFENVFALSGTPIENRKEEL